MNTVVPRPRSADLGDGTVDLTALHAIGHDAEEPSTIGGRRLRRLLDSALGVALPVESGADSDRAIDVRTVSAIEWADGNDEAYRLSIDESRIELAASTAAGVFYGAQTLVGLASVEADSIVVPTGEVRDRPESEWRGFMADPARGFIPVDRLRTIVDKLASAKLNVLHLHLADNEAWRLPLESYPELRNGPDGEPVRTYDREALEELVAYATDREVTIVPEIDVPGHALTLLENVPALRCDTDEPVEYDHKSSICVGQEFTYEFLETVLAEVVEIFPSEVVHVGADEWYHEGSLWADCTRCRERMAEQGHDDVHELFYEFLRRVHDILEAHDRRMMVWNDQIDVSDAPDVPRDILVHFWRVDPRLVSVGDWDPPESGNSMQGFLEAGFDVVNSRSSYTYLNLDGSRLPQWTPTSKPEIEPRHHEGVLGGEMAAWNGWKTDEMQSYYRRTLPSALAVLGDRLWNGSAIDDDEKFSRAVTRHVLGPSTPSGFDLYEALGGVVPPGTEPKDANKARVLDLAAEHSFDVAIENTLGTLDIVRRLESADVPPPDDVYDAYVDTLDWLVDALESERRGIPAKTSMEKWQNR